VEDELLLNCAESSHSVVLFISVATEITATIHWRKSFSAGASSPLADAAGISP
jgi:hypothetical protein